MTEEDLKFIVCVLKGQDTGIQPNWYSVLGFLFCHRIAGLFYSRAKKNEVELPKKIEKILLEIFEKQKRKISFMRKELAIISEKLISINAAHVVLKGGLLSNISEDDEMIYDDGERISNDIDILVKPDGIDAVGKALSELGFLQGCYNAEQNKIDEFSRLEIVKRRMNRGEVAPYVKLTGEEEFPYIEVDINFSLGNTPGEGKELLAQMVNNSAVYYGKVKLKVSEQELFYLHLIMHQYKESCLLFMTQRGKDLDLYKLADIYYIFKSDVLDIDLLNKYIVSYGVEQEVGSVLQQVGEVFMDSQLIELSQKYKHEQPKVIDYDNKKVYAWEATIRERICNFKTGKYLKEVE